MTELMPSMRVAPHRPLPKGPKVRSVLQLAAGTGLSLGIADLAVGYATGSEVRLAWLSFLPFLSATCLVGFGAFLCLWWIVVAPIGRRLRLYPTHLALSTAAGSWSLAFGALLGVVLMRTGKGSWNFVDLGWTPLFGCVVALAVYVVLVVRGPHLYARSGHTLLGLLGCALVFALLIFLRGSFGRSVEGLAAAGLALPVLAWLAFKLCVSSRSQRPYTLTVFGLFALALLSPAATYLARTAAAARLEQPAATSAGSARRVILIVLDTLRADFLLGEHEQAPETPNIERLARDSVIFRATRAPAPWTLPSMISMMTGVSPLVHGAVKRESVLPPALPSLAQELSQAGFRTAAFGQNSFLLARSKLDRGFETYSIFPFLKERSTPLGGAIVDSLGIPPEPSIGCAQHLNSLALPWLSEHVEEDFFLWMHYFDVHVPYTPAEEFLQRDQQPSGMGASFANAGNIRRGFFTPDRRERAWIRELYAAELRQLDVEIGRFLAHLDALGIYEDSLIVLTSDHGEEFWEHDGFEHGHTVYDEVLAVPLMFKLPGRAGQGLSFEDPVSIESVMPTVLSQLGLAYDADRMTGRTLFRSPSMGDLELEPRPFLCTGNLYYQDRAALIFDGLKYVRFLQDGREELYDLEADPGEHNSLHASAPDKLAQIRELFQEQLQAAAEMRQRLGIAAQNDSQLSGEVLNQLRTLGYAE